MESSENSMIASIDLSEVNAAVNNRNAEQRRESIELGIDVRQLG